MNNNFNHTVIIHNNNDSLTVVRTTKFLFGIFVFCFVFVIKLVKQLSVFFMSCFLCKCHLQHSKNEHWDKLFYEL